MTYKNIINPLFFRCNYLGNPIVSLTKEQRKALNRFREKLTDGVYSFEKASCLCGEYNGKLIAQRDRYALSVNTLLCRSCGVMWQNPRMTEESLAEFYEKDYRAIYSGHEQATDDFFMDQVQHGKVIYDFVASCIETTQNPTVFEVGCGAGGVLAPFQQAGWRAFGCDVGNDYLRRGRVGGLVLEHGDVNILARHGRADLVILSHVLEHLPYPRNMLEQLAKLVSDRGYIYVELPGIYNIHRTYGDFLLFLQNAHLYHFTLATLVSLMAQAGFILVKGNEYIKAVFRKNGEAPSVSTLNQYKKILVYLYFMEVRRLSARLIRNIFGDNLVDNVKRGQGAQ
ncbi:MAG: hypothetical protein SRB1_02457 [Desulfobacteraceae bacterium Eth-SRB1]|nr:MAG: hypothetical protein SRB1_02457 [Desulfobacteraceae bacterium Eth-SRB1]